MNSSSEKRRSFHTSLKRQLPTPDSEVLIWEKTKSFKNSVTLDVEEARIKALLNSVKFQGVEVDGSTMQHTDTEISVKSEWKEQRDGF